MPKRHMISEIQLSELGETRKKNKNKTVEKRLQALELHADGIKHEKIAEKTGYTKTYISELVCKYCKNGIAAITQSKYGGNHRNLSLAEEAALLDSFKQLAEAGQVVEVGAIKRAYEAKLGRKIKSKGHIYYILKKHGWRKIMPRSKHPNKASDEAIEASKKLKLESKS